MDNGEPKTKVKIYSAPWCVYCRMAKEYLKSKNVEYDEVDVDANPQAARELVQKTGQAGIPVLEIGDQTILGFDRIRIDSVLNQYKLV
jgi:glutaredoxin 3